MARVVLIVTTLASLAIAEETPADLMQLSLQELMDIDVVSVSRRSEPLAEAASSIQVVTNEDIRRSGATSLPETLRLASNLQVAQVDARQWAISSRGFNNVLANKLLVMIDGRTVYTPLFAGVFWDAQHVMLADVDRIEVISGPGATLWGSNAVNGVINVVTRSADQTQGLFVEGGAGNEVEGFGSVRYGGKLAPNVFYRVYGQYRAIDDTRLVSGGDGNDSTQSAQGGARVDWKPTDVTTVTLQGDLYDSAIDRPTTDDIDVAGGNLLVRWQQRLGERSDLQLQAYWDRTYRHIPGTFGETLDTYDIDFQHGFPLGESHQATWGLGYRVMDDRVDNSAALAFVPSDMVRDLISAFVQDEITLVQNKLSLTLGTKVEHNDYTGTEVQPSGRLAWRPADDHTLWAGAARAVRTPSRIDRDYRIPGVAPYSLEGGDFDSEKLWSYEIGYRVRPNESVAVSATVFYHDYDDIRSVQQVSPPTPSPIVVANGFTATSYGVELAVDYRATQWCRLRGGWTEMRIDFDTKPGSTDTTGGSAESADSERWFTLGSQIDFSKQWQADVAYRYVGGIANRAIPGYHEINARIGWRHRDLDLSVIGQNLLNDDHTEFGPTGGGHVIERSVYGRVQCRF